MSLFFNNDKCNNESSDSDNESSDSDNESVDSNDSIESNKDTCEKVNFDDNITLFGEKKGKRTNTYIAGLLIDNTQKKLYLKTLKKRHGCNGTIKSILYNEKEQDVIQ